MGTDRRTATAEIEAMTATARANAREVERLEADLREVREALAESTDALNEWGAELLDRTPDLVEPQLDAMSDDEARDHAFFHQLIKPAVVRARGVLEKGDKS